MEVRVYMSFHLWSNRKVAYSHKIVDIVNFSYDECVRVFKSLYGTGCIIEFIVI